MAGRGSLSRSGAPTSLGSGPSVVRKQESRWQKMGFMINDSKDVSPAVVIVVFSALSRPLLGSCRKVAAPMQSCCEDHTHLHTCTCTHCPCRKVAVVRQKFVAVVFPASVCVKVFDAHLHKFAYIRNALIDCYEKQGWAMVHSCDSIASILIDFH